MEVFGAFGSPTFTGKLGYSCVEVCGLSGITNTATGQKNACFGIVNLFANPKNCNGVSQFMIYAKQSDLFSSLINDDYSNDYVERFFCMLTKDDTAAPLRVSIRTANVQWASTPVPGGVTVPTLIFDIVSLSGAFTSSDAMVINVQIPIGFIL